MPRRDEEHPGTALRLAGLLEGTNGESQPPRSPSGGRGGRACRRIDQPPLRRQSHGHSAGFGMGIHDDFQSQGIGTRLMEPMLNLADNRLNLWRVDLQVYTDNEPGIALYKKFGFEIEGTHRNHAFREGQYVDSCTMARLKK